MLWSEANGLHKLLQDLQNLASQKNETDLLEFLKRFVGKQKRNIKYLEYQHSYQKELERLTSKEGISEQFGEHPKATQQVFHRSSSQKQLLKNLDLYLAEDCFTFNSIPIFIVIHGSKLVLHYKNFFFREKMSENISVGDKT